MRNETTQTTKTITPVSSSNLRSQSTSRSPELNQSKRTIVAVSPWRTTSVKTTIAITAAMPIEPHVTSWAPRAPSTRPNRPAITAPKSGRKMGAA